MNYTLVATLAYLAAAVAMTLYVGRTLRHHGRPFLDEAFKNTPALADAVNVLLNVGFYLVNLGIIGASLKYPLRALDLVECIQVAGYRLGVELLLLGLMHLCNLYVIGRIRRGERRPAAHIPAPLAS